MRGPVTQLGWAVGKQSGCFCWSEAMGAKEAPWMRVGLPSPESTEGKADGTHSVGGIVGQRPGGGETNSPPPTFQLQLAFTIHLPNPSCLLWPQSQPLGLQKSPLGPFLTLPEPQLGSTLDPLG